MSERRTCCDAGGIARVSRAYRQRVSAGTRPVREAGKGAKLDIETLPRGYRLHPVEAVQAWLTAAEISTGPVFRPMLKGGRLQDAQLFSAWRGS